MDTAKRNACSRCRGLKLRCLLDTFAGHGKCRRCYETGNDCIFETIAPRQRRKRTDTRVAALEKQIAGLKAAIDQRPVGDDVEDGARRDVNQLDSAVPWKNDSQVDDAGPSGHGNERIGTIQHPTVCEETIPGLIGTDILSLEASITLFDEFKNNVLPTYPVLELTDDNTFTSLRSSQPLLLLATVTAASRGSDQRLFADLHSRLRSLLADAVLVRGQCSLDIIQAILVMEVWYHPPEDLRHLNFYMWIQIASTLVRQLGLWPWAVNPSKESHNSFEQFSNRPRSDIRTAFAVYLSMSTVAISLRRPKTMIWTEHARACLQVFDMSAQNANDKRLVAWVRLQLLAEDVETLRIALSNSPEPEKLEQSFPADRQTIQDFERRFTEWRDDNFDVTDDSLQVHFFYCRSKLYELAFLSSQTRPTSISHSEKQTTSVDHTTDMVWALMSLIQASHNVLDVLLRLDITTYLKCPTVTTVRALYAMLEIYLVWRSTKHPNPQLPQCITEEALATTFYLKRMHGFLERARGPAGFAVPDMALKSLASITKEVLNSTTTTTSHPPAVVDTSPAADCATKSTDSPANDLEAILTLATTHFEANAGIRPVARDTSSTVSGQTLDTSTAVYFQPEEHNELNREGEQMIFSEFDMMIMPDAGWVFGTEF